MPPPLPPRCPDLSPVSPTTHRAPFAALSQATASSQRRRGVPIRLAASAPRRPRASRNGRQTLVLAPGARQIDRCGACGVRRDRTALPGAGETADRLDDCVEM